MFSLKYSLEESSDFQTPQKSVSKLESNYIKLIRHVLKDSCWENGEQESQEIKIIKGQDKNIFLLLICH